MLLCVDIGASKTLLAAFTEEGKLEHEFKFPTPKNYRQFVKDLKTAIKVQFGGYKFRAAALAAPGTLDLDRGVGLRFGNLSWRNVPLKADLEAASNCPVKIGNDTKLAGLSEAKLLHKQYKKVLYLTVSTGIGDALIVNGEIDSGLSNSEGGQMMIMRGGQLKRWEDFASGKALVKKYGRLASEIDEPEIWEEFSDGLAQGLGQLLAVIQPEVVVIGGGVGTHFHKYEHFLHQALETKYKARLVRIPPIIKAKRPEEAVVYGCYELIRHKA